MLNNVFLFTGEEQFLLDKELFRRKENFVLKYGQDSVFPFDVENFDLGILKQAIYGGGLFVTKKMVVLNGIPLDATAKLSQEKKIPIETFLDDFLRREGKIPEETLLVFVSPKPDKRLKLFKFLERNTTVKEFKQYKERELKEFIISQLSGIYIPNDVVEYFLIKVGADLYRLRFECEKLKIRCEAHTLTQIDQALIDKVVFGMVETDAFTLLENIFTHKKTSVEIIDKVKADGEDRNKFAGMLYRSLKLSLFIVDLYQSGVTNAAELASRLWAGPWQISKSLKAIGHLQSVYDDMKVFYRGLVELDYGIKTGKYPDSYFWLGIKRMLK